MKEHLKKYFPDRFDEGGGRLPIKLPSIFKIIGTDHRRLICEKKVQDLFEQSNELKLLVGAMRKYGCNFDISRHIACETCNGCQGGYDPDTNQIVVNKNLGRNKMLRVIAHEMIHMFDYCRANFDFTNLEHVACSEIRAANLTHCSISDKISMDISGIFNLKKTHRHCVKDVAFKSVEAYSPEKDSAEIWQIVDNVFPTCYNDLEPFGRRPANGSRDFKQSYRERYYYGYV